ncbi:MAG: hypothetical protein R3234_02945 [Thermoanaerobaculia bacterium]|nr:hypothetical protein [Thermoanaerobaculia bacterium]
MRRPLIVVLVVMLMVAAAPSWARPFGSFGGLTGGQNAASGVAGVVGWALDPEGIQAVDIYVDGQPAGRAFYGLGRPDVTARFPGFPDSDLPGFGFFLDTTHYFNGLHTVRALAISVDGSTTWLQARQIEFMNSTHLLAPFGQITYPRKHAELFGVCNDLQTPNRRYAVIEGWVLDVGVEKGDQGGPPNQGDPSGDSGVGYVELLIDGALWANSKVSCDYVPAKGGLSDCYGLESPEIERLYADVPDSPHARFRFVLDVGLLVASGYSRGTHVLTIRSGDIAGQVANVDENVVNFRCVEDRGNDPSFGQVDNPNPVDVYSDVIRIRGWALDLEGVESVEVLADGVPIGEATYGIRRPEVSSRHPGFPDSPAPGYILDFDTNTVADGWVDLVVRVTDIEGESTVIGERTIRVNNLKGE